MEQGIKQIIDRTYADCRRQSEMNPEYEITLQDMYLAMKAMNPNKAPGPDGIRL